jgi:methyl-accepting chemotaxis protein
MSEYDTIKDQQIEHTGSDIESLLYDLSDRLSVAADDISDLADGVEELGDEIQTLLEDIRTIQGKTDEGKKEKLESLIDQLEGISKELQSTLWTMDFASEDLLENSDL